MDSVIAFLKKYISVLSFPKLTVVDVLEILIIAFVLYLGFEKHVLGLWSGGF